MSQLNNSEARPPARQAERRRRYRSASMAIPDPRAVNPPGSGVGVGVAVGVADGVALGVVVGVGVAPPQTGQKVFASSTHLLSH